MEGLCVRFMFGFHSRTRLTTVVMVVKPLIRKLSTEVRNWDDVAKALEASGNTTSQMYIRAKALALGKLDPMPTSSPEAPFSVSAVAG